jgi:hypothetical protein
MMGALFCLFERLRKARVGVFEDGGINIEKDIAVQFA